MTEQFGAWLRDQRTAAGMTPAGLARKMGVTRGTVSRWESGERTPDAGTVHLIARAVDAPEVDALRVAGHHDDAERVQGYHAEVATDPMVTARRALGALPMRPAARGALVKLAEELTRDHYANVDAHIDQAWDYAAQAIGAAEPLSRSQWEQRVQSRFRRKLLELLGVPTP